MKKLIMLAAALLSAGAASVLTAPAASAVPGLSFASASSALDGTDTKSVSVPCPAGTVPFGGGFFISISGGAGGRVSVTRLQALPPSNTFAVTATEVAGAAPAAWRLHGYAICGASPAGLTYVSFTTGTDSSSVKTATASCPAGKQLLGVGARLEGDGGQVLFDDVRPSATLTSATAVAYEDGTGYAGNWRLRAFGVCANPVANLSLQTADTLPANSVDDGVGVGCPAGTKVHGVGGAITGATGRAMFGGLYPAANLASGVAVAAEQNGGYNGDWYTRVYAICAS